MAEYWILTSGKGCLPPGRKVGYIEADSPEHADALLVETGQISSRFAGFFDYLLKEGTNPPGSCSGSAG